MTDPGVDGLALLDGNSSPASHSPALDAEQVRARRLGPSAGAAAPPGSRSSTRDRARTSCSRRASRRRRTRQRSSGIHTASSSPRHSNIANVRASSLSVFARALRDPGVIRADHDHPVHMRLEQPRDLPAAAGHLQRHPIGRPADSPPASAIPSGVLGTRPAERTCPSSQIATTQKSRCTSRPIARPTHLATRHVSPPRHRVDMQRENQRDNDTDRYELEAQSRQVAGAAERKARARSPSTQNGLPVCVLPKKAPVPDQPNLGPAPDRPSKKQFHAATSGRRVFAGCSPIPKRAGLARR